MTVRVGVVLPSLLTLGPAPSSDQIASPPGNGFLTRYAEDLAALAEAGCTDVRLPFDWAWLLPGAGRVDHDAIDWYDHVLDAARGVGITTWASLFEGPLPGWFVDEGGWADARAAGRHWPRLVELVADTFGDRVTGWFPIDRPTMSMARAHTDPERHAAALTNLVVAWRDAWRILHGGPPVCLALDLSVLRPRDDSVEARSDVRLLDRTMWNLWLQALRDGTVAMPGLAEREVADLQGGCDRLGVAVAFLEPTATHDALARFSDDTGSVLRRLAEEAPERPIVVSSLTTVRADDEDRTQVIDVFGEVLTSARRDGIPIDLAFHRPGIDRPDTSATGPGLLDGDRVAKPSAEHWRALTS